MGILGRNDTYTASPADHLSRTEEERNMIGSAMNFASSEAYKLLRTNLMFSLAGDKKCHIIGVTSALRNEGKSLTAMNVACSLAEAGQNVLLLECDLRIPTIAKRLRLTATPGLSNLLVGMSTFGEVIQSYPPFPYMDVISAGDIPPNPSELLGSEQMEAMVKKISEYYDYIIIDLPPVSAVSDALVVSKLTDGMVVVVRSDYGERSGLNDTMRRLQFVDAKILGFVYNCASESATGYSKYRGKRYHKYYKTYKKGRGYEKFDSPGGEQ